MYGAPRLPTDIDVALATRTEANVLITGPVETALTLARRIHDESGWRHGPFTIIDCRQGQGLGVQLASVFGNPGPRAAAPHARLMQNGSVLLLEVGHAPRDVQTWLARQLAELRRASRSRPRLLASSSEELLPRVVDGTFNDQLFYRLNVIHLSSESE